MHKEIRPLDEATRPALHRIILVLLVIWLDLIALGGKGTVVLREPGSSLPPSPLTVKTLSQTTLQPVSEVQGVYIPPAPVVTAIAIVSGCGDNSYANYIYSHESGCNLSAVNYLGCRGIGQACPGSKLPCGADYACQNAYFTSYALRYGGWAGAYNFWLGHHWW